MTIAERIRATRDAFLASVWPLLRRPFGGGVIVPVEEIASTEYGQKCLDCFAGIDSWHIDPGRQTMRGLASRVQWTGKLFHTFTIRFKRQSGNPTEFHKRLAALTSRQDWLLPAITVQAYLAGERYMPGPARLVLAAYTRDLFRVILEGERGEKGWSCDWYVDSTNPGVYRNGTDTTDFIVVPVDTLRRWGIRHVCLPPPPVPSVASSGNWQQQSEEEAAQEWLDRQAAS